MDLQSRAAELPQREQLIADSHAAAVFPSKRNKARRDLVDSAWVENERGVEPPHCSGLRPIFIVSGAAKRHE
jgi:hypothetical protein